MPMKVNELYDILKPLKETVVCFIKIGVNQDSPCIDRNFKKYMAIRCQSNNLVIPLTDILDMEDSDTEDIEKKIKGKISNPKESNFEVLLELESGLYRIYVTEGITLSRKLCLFFSEETKVQKADT